MQIIEENITILKTIVQEKQYDFEPVKFRQIIGKLLKSGKNEIIEEYLDIFINDATTDFYKSQLAIMILGIYEKHLKKDKALEIAKKILEYTEKPSYALSSILRICRVTNNYQFVDKLFKEKAKLMQVSTFEVMYELTFYYYEKQDINSIENLLEKIINQYKGKKNDKPIINTVKALSIKYGLFEKFKPFLVSNEKNNLSESSEKVIINQIFNEEYERLLEDYEPALRSAALTDLTKGIAHEFGQPVTNIRFGIQYYSKIIEEQQSDKIDKEIVLNVFSDILLQTKRIGELIDTLSPITSTKSKITKFNIKNAIKYIFEQEKIKLNSLKIEYLIKSYKNKDIKINFDNIQFNQIIANLLNNSIDSISEVSQKNYKGKIIVSISESRDKYTIRFSDNGKGITKKQRKRIFNPFYTTKEVGKGQGLGLYIVSKLLEINGGKIYLDNQQKKGAKFIINIIKKNTDEIQNFNN